jgi:hypothetical protein
MKPHTQAPHTLVNIRRKPFSPYVILRVRRKPNVAESIIAVWWILQHCLRNAQNDIRGRLRNALNDIKWCSLITHDNIGGRLCHACNDIKLHCNAHNTIGGFQQHAEEHTVLSHTGAHALVLTGCASKVYGLDASIRSMR